MWQQVVRSEVSFHKHRNAVIFQSFILHFLSMAILPTPLKQLSKVCLASLSRTFENFSAKYYPRISVKVCLLYNSMLLAYSYELF